MTNVFAGNLDGAVFRYTLLLADFINKIDWMNVNDFKNFAAVIYPSLMVRKLMRAATFIPASHLLT